MSTLDFSHFGVADDAMKESFRSRLSVSDLIENYIVNGQAQEICERLVLRENMIGDNGFEKLLRCLENNELMPKLRVLDMSSNQISLEQDDLFKLLVSVLTHRENLFIDIVGNRVPRNRIQHCEREILPRLVFVPEHMIYYDRWATYFELGADTARIRRSLQDYYGNVRYMSLEEFHKHYNLGQDSAYHPRDSVPEDKWFYSGNLWSSVFSDDPISNAVEQFAESLFQGHGMRRDPDVAIKLLAFAEKRGCPDASYFLGEILRRHRHSECKQFYQKASETGHRLAQESLVDLEADTSCIHSEDVPINFNFQT
eukprot:GILJ01006774.1.p1 GENE.GILJ01006774.1~~GILJ01006774.1.p1  ORF type:complete len:312 (-),score=19.82 GILJ01006774.1:256-1191(-)